MNGKIRVGIAAAALGMGLAMAPTTASAVQQAPAAAQADTGAKKAAACSEEPERGWVLFYEHTNCQGHYQGWSTCEPHNFTGPMKLAASSYRDNQYGRTRTEVTDQYGSLEPVFVTIADNHVHNLAWDENDLNWKAWLNC